MFHTVLGDSQVKAIRVHDPEVLQAPGLHFDISIQCPTLLDNPLPLSLQVVHFNYNLHPSWRLSAAPVRRLQMSQLEIALIRSNEDAVSLKKSIAVLSLHQCKAQYACVESDALLQVGREHLKAKTGRHVCA